MKVILIKDSKHGKKNSVIEVADGFAKNFLIKNGFAQPYNSGTKKSLEKRNEILKEKHEENIKNANLLKQEIEKITLKYKLKVDNMAVHGSITHKPILKDLKSMGINVDRYSLPNHIHVNTLGISKIEVSLYDNVKATLKIEVSKDE
ncbi:MAG: 50S ribosomal protein L9 [Mycoplasma sp.]|nr:50S ribosomal protein L9 [Mycoplasma sp.]